MFAFTLPLIVTVSDPSEPSVVLPSTCKAFVTLVSVSATCTLTAPPVTIWITSAAASVNPVPAPKPIPVPVASLSPLASIKLL